MITVLEEKTVDYEATARIATEAFDSNEIVFAAERMKWLYERGFGQGTTILAVASDGVKIGQIALVHHTMGYGGETFPAIQLVDLFVSKEHRSPQLIRRIYKEVEQLCIDRNIRFILAMPNETATLLNVRFLKLKNFLELPIRAGAVFLPPRFSKLKYSGRLKSMTKQEAVDLLSGFATPTSDNGLQWNGDHLFERMNSPTSSYAVHIGADLLLISSSRITRGIKHTLLCGFFARSGATVTPGSVRELVRAACYFWKKPLFVYAGINGKLPRLPGFTLSSRIRSPILVQLRDFMPGTTELPFDRFQLIDSDFV